MSIPYIKKVHTNSGDVPIDYDSLANLPDISAVVEQAGFMKKDDSSYARSSTQSEAFNAEKEYSIGDYCIYENVLYKFTEAKVAGEWDSTKATATTIDAELKAHATAISEQNVNFAELKEKIYTQQFTGVTDSAGRISTLLSADETKIISARVVSPRNVAQYELNITVNPSDVEWYLNCTALENTQVTYEALIYKI